MSPPDQDESTNSVRKRVKGTECTLYDARSKSNQNYSASATEEFLANLKKESPNVYAIFVICNKSNLVSLRLSLVKLL